MFLIALKIFFIIQLILILWIIMWTLFAYKNSSYFFDSKETVIKKIVRQFYCFYINGIVASFFQHFISNKIFFNKSKMSHFQYVSHFSVTQNYWFNSSSLIPDDFFWSSILDCSSTSYVLKVKNEPQYKFITTIIHSIQHIILC
jgi:hypothetical protein